MWFSDMGCIVTLIMALKLPSYKSQKICASKKKMDNNKGKTSFFIFPQKVFIPLNKRGGGKKAFLNFNVCVAWALFPP